MGPVDRMRARQRYREMERRLAELDALDREHGLGAVGHTPAPTRRRGLGVRTQRVLASLFALSMVGLVVVFGLASPGPYDDRPAAADPPVAAPTPLEPTGGRVRGVVPVVSEGAHAFLDVTPDGRPVSFDPCESIHYVFNPVGMPPGGAQQLRDAIREISDATGLDFVEDGVTSEPLVEDRESRQPDRYGPNWAPVLIGWVDEAEFPLLASDVVGIANSVSAAPAGTEDYRYVTGLVALDRTWFAEAASDPDTARESYVTLLHELGHLVGLDHVEDPTEVMGAATEATELGPGDRQGLALVGSGDCAGGS
jgi:hypothetical protein